MTFALFMCAPADGAEARAALGLARAALEEGHDVRLFLMGEAVRLAPAEEVVALVRQGAEVTSCAQSARACGVAPVPWVGFLDQAENAHNLAECDRWAAFVR